MGHITKVNDENDCFFFLLLYFFSPFINAVCGAHFVCELFGANCVSVRVWCRCRSEAVVTGCSRLLFSKWEIGTFSNIGFFYFFFTCHRRHLLTFANTHQHTVSIRIRVALLFDFIWLNRFVSLLWHDIYDIAIFSNDFNWPIFARIHF